MFRCKEAALTLHSMLQEHLFYGLLITTTHADRPMKASLLINSYAYRLAHVKEEEIHVKNEKLEEKRKREIVMNKRFNNWMNKQAVILQSPNKKVLMESTLRSDLNWSFLN